MSTKTLRKRIALVAVSAMGLGLLSIVVAPSASAAVTATVTPVRVSNYGVSGAGLSDAVPFAKISWVTTAAMVTTDTVTLALTQAPSGTARVKLAIETSIGTSRGTSFVADTTSAVLGTNEANFAVGTGAKSCRWNSGVGYCS